MCSSNMLMKAKNVFVCVHVHVCHTFFLDGCPGLCSGHGRCTLEQSGWRCVCQTGWSGPGCSVVMETDCSDGTDNDGGDIRNIIYHFLSLFLFLTSFISVSLADCPFHSITSAPVSPAEKSSSLFLPFIPPCRPSPAETPVESCFLRVCMSV